MLVINDCKLLDIKSGLTDMDLGITLTCFLCKEYELLLPLLDEYKKQNCCLCDTFCKRMVKDYFASEKHDFICSYCLLPMNLYRKKIRQVATCLNFIGMRKEIEHMSYFVRDIIIDDVEIVLGEEKSFIQGDVEIKKRFRAKDRQKLYKGTEEERERLKKLEEDKRNGRVFGQHYRMKITSPELEELYERENQTRKARSFNNYGKK